jgi:2-haloacid dehalogenase
MGFFKQPLEALVFDAYGTLFDVSSVAARCEHHFPGKGTAVSDLWRQKQLEYTWLVALMGHPPDFWRLTEEALRFACSAVKERVSDAVVANLMSQYLNLAVYPEVPDSLARLSAGRPLAILSNGTRAMLDAVATSSGLRKRFLHVLSVDDVGIFKPSPRVYELAERSLKVPRDRIGFVSTNAWDVAGAKSFGLKVFWINRFNRPPERLDFAPDKEIRTLDELIPLVDG